MKKYLLTALSVMVIASLFVAPVAADGPPGFEALKPGEFVVFEQDVPVNIVFIGYDEDVIDTDALLAGLPAAYEPHVRYPWFYGADGRDVGLSFDFEYNVKFAGPMLERRFFNYLKGIGEPDDLTVFQQDYNDQLNNVLDVTGPVLYIDGPSVEKWLRNNSWKLHIDIRHSYTIYFINWYDRDDFQFHVYTKTDEPDPDTGYNFGELRDSRKMIAWGGSYSRTWFYDLSAGPEAWTDNWYVDDTDLDGNGIEDYRMPPIWEYTAGGYRDPSALSSDLSLVARFVGINLLFTSSPLYDPLVTTPGLAGDKVLHLEMLEDDPADNGLDWIHSGHIYSKLHAFQPYYHWQVNLEDNAPIDPDAERAFRIFTGLLVEDDCWNTFGSPFAELYCYFTGHLGIYVPPYDPADYVGEVFAFNTTDENMGDQFGLLGFADDNWIDGTQTHVFQFDTPYYRTLGYGFSDTTVHEFGHHIGMSHPHDGWDSEYEIDYGPSDDDFYFAWVGDESNTVMSYISLSGNFGRFDRDNMYRWEMAGYLNWANDLLDDVLAQPDVYKVKYLLIAAELQARWALRNLGRWNYLRAVCHAYQAYVYVTIAAEKVGVPTTSTTFMAAQAIPEANVPHEGDPIRFPDN